MFSSRPMKCTIKASYLILVLCASHLADLRAEPGRSAPGPIDLPSFVFTALKEVTRASDLISVSAVAYRRERDTEIMGITTSWASDHPDESVLHAAHVFLRVHPASSWKVYQMHMPISSIMTEYIEVIAPRVQEWDPLLEIEDGSDNQDAS